MKLQLKHSLVLFFCLFVSLAGIAQLKPVEISGDPYGVKVYTLPNGFTIMLSVNKSAPQIQSMIAVKAGSKNDPADNTGLAHYLEHMLFKGTESYGTKSYAAEKPYLLKIENFYTKYGETTDSLMRAQLYRLIDTNSYEASKIAIANEYDRMMQSLGANGTNAFTSFDQTVYINNIPTNQLEKWLKIEGDRFAHPVFRIFHTELEAVYEEKNRGLDNDDNKAFETLMEGVFRRHPYGSQTTIGTVEHLKNPSLVKIKEYYQQHYKPNNMALILSGDFDPDEVIALVTKYFGQLEKGDIPPQYLMRDSLKVLLHEPGEMDFTVTGPREEKVFLGFPAHRAGTTDASLLYITDMILANSQAGMLDINLNKAQKVQYAVCSPLFMGDFSMHYFVAYPREGQSLDECKKLLLDELEKLKRGEFDENILKAIVENMRLSRAKGFNDNYQRCNSMMEAFVFGYNWQDYITMPDMLEKLTKADIMEFAKRTYVPEMLTTVYKTQGKDSSIQKIPKPAITPIETNRDAQSQFARKINAMPVNPIPAVFPNFETEITKTTVGRGKKKVNFHYVHNAKTDYFTLYIRFEMGTKAKPILKHMADYIPYIATANTTNEQIAQKLFGLACEYGFVAGEENSYIYLQGLNKNFDAAYALLLEIFNGAKVQEDKWNNLVQDILKARMDSKTNKGVILQQALKNYARYGKKNPFTNIISAENLKKLKAADIEKEINSLLKFKKTVMYYGPAKNDEMLGKLGAVLKPAKKLKKLPKTKKITAPSPNKPVIYFVNYDMVQAEVIWDRPNNGFKVTDIPTATIYNEYFGSGMFSLVFQTIRESKALAYSTYAYVGSPADAKGQAFVTAYVGTQSDKLISAMMGMKQLMDSLPNNPFIGDLAKESVRKQIEADRVNERDLMFTQIAAEKLGLKGTVNQLVYENLSKVTYENLVAMQKAAFYNQPFNICIIGSKDRINLEELKKIGEVKELTLEEIFGY